MSTGQSKSWLYWLHAAFHRPSTKVHRVVENMVWTLIVASILLLFLEWTVEPGSRTAVVLNYLDRVVLVVFAAEIFLRVASYQPPALKVFDRPPLGRLRAHVFSRLRYTMQPLMLFDIIAVLAVVPAMRGLRILRLLRLLRFRRIFQYANPFLGLFHAFESDRLLFWFAFSFVGVETILGGTTLFLVERGQNAGVQSIGDGIWWALVTITTVGFGDITPVTTLGRWIGGVLMIGGMFTIALFAGIVGHSLLNAVLSIREEQFRMGDSVDHIVVCGYETGSQLLLDSLRLEINLEQSRPILFGDSERPLDLPPDFMWVRGDPTKESELDKVRMSHAGAVIIVGARSTQPQFADATTILTAFTIRSYLRKHPATKHRKRPLHVVAEILDSENVDHARAAGADDVVETRRVGFSLVAHSVAYPGVADITSRVVLAGNQSIYVGTRESDDTAPIQFELLARSIFKDTEAMLIGVIDPQSGKEIVNPPKDFIVSANDHLLYLAKEPRLRGPKRVRRPASNT